MEKLQNETAMYTRLVCVDTVGHDNDTHVLEVFSIYVFIEKLLKTSF
jgi:hypothetical protein